MESSVRRLWILAGLLLAGLFVVAGLTLNVRSVTGDEVGTIWLASQPDPGSIIQFAHAHDVHPPTHYLLLHYWGCWAGYSDAASRGLSLLLLAGLLLAAYRLAPTILELPAGRARVRIFLLIATTPLLWMMGTTARYYSLAALVAFLAIAWHARWLARRDRLSAALSISGMVAVYAVHFLLPLIVLVSRFMHFLLLRRRKASRVGWWRWMLAEAVAVLIASPLIASCIGGALRDQGLGAGVFEGMAGVFTIPAFLAGQGCALVHGGILFPWDLWIVAPALMAALIVGGRAVRRDAGPVATLLLAPLTGLAVSIAMVLPVAGYFLGLLRAGYLAAVAWIVLGAALERHFAPRLRNLLFATLLASNLYTLGVWFLNAPSLQQAQPVREIASAITRASEGPAAPLVVHPFAHGWTDALRRYAPGVRSCMVGEADPDTALRAIVDAPDEVWLVQRNRFPAPFLRAAEALEQRGYVKIQEIDFQPQRAWDLWFKEALKKVPLLNLRAERSQPFILTVKCYRRAR